MLFQPQTKVLVRLVNGLAGLPDRVSRVTIDVLLCHGVARFEDFPTFRRNRHREPKADLEDVRWISQSTLCVPPPDFYFSHVQSMKEFSGLYFAYQEQMCVYVGESSNVPRRVTRHRKELHGITGIGVLECRPEDRKALESFFIGLLRPPRNRSLLSADVTRCDA